jgi:hypothetical protein
VKLRIDYEAGRCAEVAPGPIWMNRNVARIHDNTMETEGKKSEKKRYALLEQC